MKQHPTDRGEGKASESDRISSEDLAALVVDALLRADIVKSNDSVKAMQIAAEEIEVRKALGDY